MEYNESYVLNSWKLGVIQSAADLNENRGKFLFWNICSNLAAETHFWMVREHCSQFCVFDQNFICCNVENCTTAVLRKGKRKERAKSLGLKTPHFRLYFSASVCFKKGHNYLTIIGGQLRRQKIDLWFTVFPLQWKKWL